MIIEEPFHEIHTNRNYHIDMAKFLSGAALCYALEEILQQAQEKIVLISPYVKLHPRIKTTLLMHIANPKVEIVLVFGKNEFDLSKSMRWEDVEFFTQFPNVAIRYEPNLHAKFYANESVAIITSMNLHEYSQNNNIEAGVLIKSGIVGIVNGDHNLDADAFLCFKKVIRQSALLFERRPEYDRGIAGIKLNKKYLRSIIKIDCLRDYLGNSTPTYQVAEKISNYTAPKTMGYCIRTGVSIPFNPERPFSEEGYKSWSRYFNHYYKEKFCHFSGEPSNGETTFANPIMQKNLWKAKNTHRF